MTEATTSPAERAAGQVEELCGLLRQAIRGSGSTAKAVSLKLDYAPAYLTRVFKGRYALKVKHVFGILAVLGKHPADFFAEHYPLGGPLPAPPPPPDPDELLDELPREAGQEALLAEARRRWPVPGPPELVVRTRQLLAAILERKGVKRRAVDRALALGTGDRLGRALRGEADLLAVHLFGTLVVVGMAPATFFAELFRPEGRRYAEVWELLATVTAKAVPHLRRKQTPPGADNGDEGPKD